jgi:hypothetical protein
MIAKLMGQGITRCAIIGKMRRLGLKSFNGHDSIDGVTRLPRRAPQNRRQPVPITERQAEPLALGGVGNGLAPGLCQYIHGDPLRPPWRMCGHETGSRTKSYCPYHMALCKPAKGAQGYPGHDHAGKLVSHDQG